MILETGDILQLNNVCYVSIHFSCLFVIRIRAHDGTVLCLPTFVSFKGVVRKIHNVLPEYQDSLLVSKGHHQLPAHPLASS